MNSPTLDHHGKMLSYDGSKVFTASTRGRGGRGRGGNRNDRGDRKRGNDNQSNQSGGGGRGGKAKKPVIYTFTALFLLNFISKNNGGQSDNKQWCRFHQSRSGHSAEDCFLNRDSKSFKGEEFLQKFEQKHKRKVYNS